MNYTAKCEKNFSDLALASLSFTDGLCHSKESNNLVKFQRDVYTGTVIL